MTSTPEPAMLTIFDGRQQCLGFVLRCARRVFWHLSLKGRGRRRAYHRRLGCRVMTADILRFPERGPFAVRIEREGRAWLVVARDHGWLHGSHREALADAEQIARGFGVALAEP